MMDCSWESWARPICPNAAMQCQAHGDKQIGRNAHHGGLCDHPRHHSMRRSTLIQTTVCLALRFRRRSSATRCRRSRPARPVPESGGMPTSMCPTEHDLFILLPLSRSTLLPAGPDGHCLILSFATHVRDQVSGPRARRPLAGSLAARAGFKANGVGKCSDQLALRSRHGGCSGCTRLQPLYLNSKYAEKA